MLQRNPLQTTCAWDSTAIYPILSLLPAPKSRDTFYTGKMKSHKSNFTISPSATVCSFPRGNVGNFHSRQNPEAQMSKTTILQSLNLRAGPSGSARGIFNFFFGCFNIVLFLLFAFSFCICVKGEENCGEGRCFHAFICSK